MRLWRRRVNSTNQGQSRGWVGALARRGLQAHHPLARSAQPLPLLGPHLAAGLYVCSPPVGGDQESVSLHLPISIGY